MTGIILVESTQGLWELTTCFVVSVLLLASTEVLLCFAIQSHKSVEHMARDIYFPFKAPSHQKYVFFVPVSV